MALTAKTSFIHKLTPQTLTHFLPPIHLIQKRRKAKHNITSMKQSEEAEKMKISIQLGQPQSPPSDSDGVGQENDHQKAVPAKFITTADGFEKNEHSWSATSQMPTDLSIQVQDITFYVHKVDLEMTEALEEGNLISKTEAFFTFVVLSSWRDSITVLNSCETLSPWAENIQIVRRCCHTIAWKISGETSTIGGIVNGEQWWFDDISTLRIDYFTRIITALKAKGMKPDTIGSCIAQFGEKWLPYIESERQGTGRNGDMQWSIISGRKQEGEIGPTKEQRMIVESLVSLLPPQREAVSCKFLLKMLKMALLYSASPALISELEKRAGLVLEGADVNDLLIPSYAAGDQGKLVNSSEEQSMYNIEVVQRILEYFLLYEQQQQQRQNPVLLAISKLLDSYLAEIALDPKLSITKFQFLAQSLPENARTSDDGLYRAIDTYLKTHPSLSDHERRRLCKVMNCTKLSIDACAHAAKNDRLPLRTMIQVLFSEQMKVRAAVQGNNQIDTADKSDQESSQSSTKKEVKALKLELEKVKAEMAEMQRDYSEFQQEYHKQNFKQRKTSGWTVGWQKIRKPTFFNLKLDGEDTDENQNRQKHNRRGGFLRRQSAS